MVVRVTNEPSVSGAHLSYAHFLQHAYNNIVFARALGRGLRANYFGFLCAALTKLAARARYSRIAQRENYIKLRRTAKYAALEPIKTAGKLIMAGKWYRPGALRFRRDCGGARGPRTSECHAPPTIGIRNGYFRNGNEVTLYIVPVLVLFRSGSEVVAM